MVAGSTVVVGVVVVAALLAVSAFFSGSELAIFSLERHRLSALVEGDGRRARALARLREDPHRLLVTILVGNTVVNVAIVAITAILLTLLVGPLVALVATVVGLTTLVVLFGEIAPKAYGVAHAESLSLRVAGPLRTAQRILSPLVTLFETLTHGVNRLTGSSGDIERPYVTRSDLQTLVRVGEREGVIDEAERDMVQGVFDLSSTTAREVMVPRIDVVAVDVETSLSAVLDVCATERLTRLPVYNGTLDQVVGIVDIRDVERALREEGELRDVLLPTIQVPEGREIDDLLDEMRADRVPMVIVRDEFGETEGVITVEDILEEIVGEIFEIGEERFIRPTTEGLVVRGEVTVNEVNEALDVTLPTSGDFETIAGLINDQLGRIGDVGDHIELDGIALTVIDVDGHRIRRVRVRRLDTTGGVDGDADTDA